MLMASLASAHIERQRPREPTMHSRSHEHQPAEAAVGLLRMLTGMRNGLRGASSSGGMLLVVMALAGLLTKKPGRGSNKKRSAR